MFLAMVVIILIRYYQFPFMYTGVYHYYLNQTGPKQTFCISSAVKQWYL